MRKLNVAGLAVVALLSVAVATAGSAQTVVGIGVGGGVAMPMADLGDGYKMGYTAGAGLFIYPNAGSLGFRADVGYSSFESEVSSAVKFQPLSLMGNVLYRLGDGTSSIAPYLVAGGGILSDEESQFAFQGGLGLSIGSGNVRWFVEAKYLNSSKNGFTTAFVPVIGGFSYRFR
ncbi:MAG: hypothetical protein ABR551_04020 [Gemmatimonadales bacterium]